MLPIIVKILVELVLAYVTILVGNLFWQSIKRRRFIVAALQNAELLRRPFSKIDFTLPNPRTEFFIRELPGGYAMNLQLAIKAELSSQYTGRIILIAGLLLIFGVSCFFLGLICLGINLLIFFVLSFSGISQTIRGNAFDHIEELAVILYTWQMKDAGECDKVIEQAYSLRPLYDAVLEQP